MKRSKTNEQLPTRALQVTINNTEAGAQPTPVGVVSSAPPLGVLQTWTTWSLNPGPALATSSFLQPQPQFTSAPTNQTWASSWNPQTGTYALVQQFPQVPQMSTGMMATNWPQMQPVPGTGQPSFHPIPVHNTQQVLPTPQPLQQIPQGSPAPNALPATSPMQPPQHLQPQSTIGSQSSVPVSPSVPVATQQADPQPHIIPPIILAMISSLQFHNLPGKTQCKISNHVGQSIKNKIWSYSYVDLGALLDSNTNPEDEEEYDLFPDRTNNCFSFKPSNKHASITSFSVWNQAFHVLIEITCVKWPHLCLPMVQYSHIISEQAGKFPFQQVCSYDKCFHHQLVQDPSQPWNLIDNQIWSHKLHGHYNTGHDKQ